MSFPDIKSLIINMPYTELSGKFAQNVDITLMIKE